MTGRGRGIVWFRRDLRLSDNGAVRRAVEECAEIVPLFVVDDRLWSRSANRAWFLSGCLDDLDQQLATGLVVRHGDAPTVIAELMHEHDADRLYRAEESTPYGHRRDAEVDDVVAGRGGSTIVADHPTVVPIGRVRTANDEPYKVFTPYYRQWAATPAGEPRRRPASIATVSDVESDPRPDVPEPTAFAWRPEPGETAGRAAIDRFLRSPIDHYADGRDVPAADATSRLGAYLKFGCVHPRQILHRLDGSHASHQLLAKQLAWRDFYADVLTAWPDSAWSSWNPALADIELDTGAAADERFEAWCAGRTGYPLVDAGMRQLVAEGFMHNRVRMLVASFLVKDLHLDWTRGARWFLDHLFDGDLASNNHSWQWAAGTGTDAAPYFRVFSPMRQSERFDPDGDYIRTWIPELADVERRYLHEPAAAPDGPSTGYPEPIVDHATERAEALRRFGRVRR